MTFLAWTFLFGVVAVAGPILAHLLSKPRFRRVPFTMLRFLRSGQSYSRSRRRLRDLLILLLRCAIIVLIAVLFAQPALLVKAEPRTRRAVYHVALDDSMSMAYRDGGGALFERMTEKAVEYIRRAPEDAAFNIYGLASGRAGAGLAGSQAIVEVKRFAPVPASIRLDGFLSALRKTDPATTSVVVLLSDFTPSVLSALDQVQEPVGVGELHVEPVAPESPAENAGILAAHLAGISGDTLNLDVTVYCRGPAQLPCMLTARVGNSDAVCRQELNPPPGRPTAVRVRLDLPLQLRRPDAVCLPVELSLSPVDGLPQDNTYRLGVHIPQAGEKKVIVVHKGEETFLFETALRSLADSGSLAGLSLTRVPQGRLTSRELDGADVVVFGSMPRSSSYRAGDLHAFARQGGTLLFFTTEDQDMGAVSQLLREGLLAAHPQRYVPGLVYPEPRPCPGAFPALDAQAARSLCNYRLDRIALKGYWHCVPAARAQCLWRLNNGQGFIYAAPCGNGLSILVNTSIDDSLGLLAKSGAWVAFCRYLLGGDDSARQYGFCADERPTLYVVDSPARYGRVTASVENCDGSAASVRVQGNTLLMPAPTGLGWMKARLPAAPAAAPATRQDFVLHAGINLPAGETDLTLPTQEAIAAAVQHAFVQTGDRRLEVGGASNSPSSVSSLQRRPIWRYFAWAAILLLVLESAVANRLKR